jgi:HEAT repeat protein
MPESLTAGIVRILNAKGQTMGAGFVVARDGLIATCAHVVAAAGAAPGGRVRVIFYATGKERVVKVERTGWRDPDAEDIAILRLVKGTLPEGVEPLPLGPSGGSAGHPFKTFGFPAGGPEGGVWGDGHLLEATTLQGARVLQLSSPQITPGFSGAPVLDTVNDQVVGMVTAIARPDEYGRLTETAFITPAETLCAACPALQLQPAPLAQAYRDYILAETENVEMKGIPLPDELKPVPLDQVYIQLQAVARQAVEAQRQAERQALLNQAGETKPAPPTPGGLLRRLLGGEGERASHAADGGLITAALLRLIGEQYYRQGSLYRSDERPEPISPEEALRQHDKLVILGAPGAGKSTMLRYLARQAARQADGPLPVLVSLRDYATALAHDPTLSLRDFALSQVKDAALVPAVEAAEARGQVLWLVDALDEARGEYGPQAAGQVRYLPGRWVVTSRPVGYPGGLEDPAIRAYEVLPLAPADVDRYVHDWLGLVAERRRAGAEWAEQRRAWLRGQLERQPRLGPLTRNPLLLTFLVTLSSEASPQDLPATRGALYDRYVSRLWAGWEQQRQHYVDPRRGERRLYIGGLEGEAAYQAARQGLYYLGWRLHLLYYGGRVAGQPDRADLIAYLAGCLKRRHPAWLAGSAPEALAADILDFWRQAGLLEEWQAAGQTFFALRHLTFQEYAAAQALAGWWQADPGGAWAFVRPRLHLPAWREVLILLGHGLPPEQSERLLKRVWGAGSPYEWELRRDLRLAAAMVAGGAPASDRLARRVMSRLVGLGRSAAWTHRLTLIATYSAGLGLSWLVVARLGWDACVWAIIAILWTATWWVAGVHFRLPTLWRLLAWPDRLWPRVTYERGLLAEAGQLRDTRAVEPLLAALRDDDRHVREAAARALGHLHDTRAVGPLLAALHDWPFREAAQALGQLGDARAVEPLLATLRDRSGGVRWAAAQVLGQLGDARAVEPLLAASRDKEPSVRWAAAEALSRLGDARAVEPLLAMLQDYNVYVGWPPVNALGRLGDAAFDPLLAALRDDKWIVRQAAAQALGQLGDMRAVEPLLAALHDDDMDVRREAAQALGQLGDARAVEPLLVALHDWPVHREAAQALGQLGDAQAVEPLLAALRGGDKFIRWEAAQALGQLGDARAVEPLLAALRDEDVHKAAAKALGQLGDARAVEPLLAALRDGDEYVRQAAAQALEKLGDARVVEPLLVALRDDDGDVREAAAEALGQLGDARAVEPLLAALRDNHEDVREAAAQALGQLGDARAVGRLLAALGDSDWNVRHAAAYALESVSRRLETSADLPRVQSAAWWALADAHEFVRWTAYQTLVTATQRRTLLQGEDLPVRDGVIADTRSPWRRWAGPGLLGLALALLASALALGQNLLSTRLEPYLPAGLGTGIGLVALVLLLPLLIWALQRWRRSD